MELTSDLTCRGVAWNDVDPHQIRDQHGFQQADRPRSRAAAPNPSVDSLCPMRRWKIGRPCLCQSVHCAPNRLLVGGLD